MKIRYSFFLFLLLIFCGCDIEISKGPDNSRTADAALCEYFWTRVYYEGTVQVWQQFRFEEDGTGTEVIKDSVGGRKEYVFKWYWEDDSYRTLCLKYGGTGIVLWQEIFITSVELSCLMEGQRVVFDYDLYYLN